MRQRNVMPGIAVIGGGSVAAAALAASLAGSARAESRVPRHPREARDLDPQDGRKPTVRDWEFRGRKGDRPR